MLMCQKQQLSWWCRGGQTDLGVEGGAAINPLGLTAQRRKRKTKKRENNKTWPEGDNWDLEGISYRKLVFFFPEFSCDFLCSVSGPRLHQERLPWLCTSDLTGGGVSSEGLLAAQRGVWAPTDRRRVALAWPHPHAPAVPRAAWGRRVSVHGVRTLWGSLVRVCPTIQRLPVCLPDRLGGTPEFLRLPFRLRKCVVLAPLSPTGVLAPVLAPWDPCDAVMCQQGGIQRHQQGQSCGTAG